MPITDYPIEVFDRVIAVNAPAAYGSVLST